MSLSTTQYGYIVDPMVPFTDDKGKTIKNGFIRVFMAGTSTPVLTYRNYDGATNQEKIELDNSGRVKHNVIGSKGSLYKVVVYNILHSQENPLLTVDKIAVLGASVTGTTVVTGLDSVKVQEENFLKATVEGTGVELAIDPTEVTSEVSTIGAAETAAPDYVVPLLEKTGTEDSKKISLANLFKFDLDWISRLATTITSFASGDFIAVSNTTDGSRKMAASKLLELTAHNALDGNLAPTFDPTRDEEHKYLAGESVLYDNKRCIFLVDHYGAWDWNHAQRVDTKGSLGLSDVRGSHYPLSTFQYKFNGVNAVLAVFFGRRQYDTDVMVLRVLHKNLYNSTTQKYRNQLTISILRNGSGIDYINYSEDSNVPIYQKIETYRSADGTAFVVVDWSQVPDGFSHAVVATDSRYVIDESKFYENNNVFSVIFSHIYNEYQHDNKCGVGQYPFASRNYKNKDIVGILGVHVKHKVDGASYLVRVLYNNADIESAGDYSRQISIDYYKNGSRTSVFEYRALHQEAKLNNDVEVFENDAVLLIVDWSKIPDGYNHAVADDSSYYLADDVFVAENNVFLKLYSHAQNIMADHLQTVNPHNITKAMLGITNASPSNSGLMSPEDKVKLDNIVSPVSINITGSGVYKNASAFGFLPTASAADNADALLDAVQGGGTIVVDIPGVYKVNKSILLPSNTTLVFGAGVYVEWTKVNNVAPTYLFANAGILTKSENENIEIIGLNIVANTTAVGNDIDYVYGLRGFISLFRVKNVELRDITITNTAGSSEVFGIHVADFDGVLIDGVKVYSPKDGVHVGKGVNIAIRNGRFKTNDDAIALNANDYAKSQPIFGDIENVLIENIYLESAPSFNRGRGFLFALGAWRAWSSGMTVRLYGDKVVSDGKVYASETGNPNTDTATSTVQPTHTEGVVTGSDGIAWRYIQDGNIFSATQKNVTIRNYVNDRDSSRYISIEASSDIFCRLQAPDTTLPKVENLVIEGVCGSALPSYWIFSNAAIDSLKIENCRLKSTGSIVYSLPNVGFASQTSKMCFVGNDFIFGDGLSSYLVKSPRNMVNKVKTLGSIKSDDSVTMLNEGNVTGDMDVT